MGMYVEVDHPVAGTFRTLAAPFTMSGTPLSIRGVGPEIGEHTDEVLSERGIDTDRIAQLRADGVLGGG
jgi:formyl-CoA transferase